ncbi:AzlC family ABC transporter permease [Ligilactobacillus ceti]|uniref:LIV-E family branched chain amino acid permease AzlC n=1 Tax=Ligilactobacillus ceti DSM 22408 TaxID=1122146 RepID=A0A0R2KJ34_9LACO|nr:AzlC family ABC transporter permease [Ligilactobacillus ceti]KRN89376.1 LIV-E family branched chain amino acid permease AzlC [Ligilactobacillus ceti DSM 22408]
MKKEEPRWLEVLKVSLPLCLSYVPIGLACGILLNASGFNTWMTGLVSLLVFSGGGQFMIASMLTSHAPIHTILVMLFFLELRYALLGSSLSQYLKGTSKKFLYIFAISMNDENYAVNYLKFATDKEWSPKDALMVEHYSLLFWTLANIVGGLIGNLITINLEIVDFALTALFLYMVVMQFKNKLTILISFLAAIFAVIAMSIFKSTMGLVVATLIASFVGFAIEDYLVKHGKAKGFWLKVIKPKASRKVISKSGE